MYLERIDMMESQLIFYFKSCLLFAVCTCIPSYSTAAVAVVASSEFDGGVLQLLLFW